MALSRRNVLIGLGTLVTGAGAAFGTGAFTTVTAERTVNVETAGDASAALALSPARDDEAYVEQTDGTIEINLDGSDSNASGLNQSARTRFENLVTVTNNGTQAITTLNFEFDVTNSSDDTAHENALSITSGDTTISADGSANLLVDSDEGSAGSDELTSGQSMPFGVEVDLLDSGISDFDSAADVTLTITAET